MQSTYQRSGFGQARSQRFAHRRPITLDNTGGGDKSNWPVRIELTSSDFDFSKTDGTDLQFRAADAITTLSHWVESWDSDAGSAVVWVRVPGISAGGKALIWLYYGRSGAPNTSNIHTTFPYGDDFDWPREHPDLSEGTEVLAATEAWETSAPHTISVIDMGADHPSGFRYWGFYGLQGTGGVGLARSNDLSTWTKFGDPIIDIAGGRWPSVVKDDDGVLHMLVNDQTGPNATREVNYYRSEDGITWTFEGVIVKNDGSGAFPGNPYLARFGGRYYAYFALIHNNDLTFRLRVRSAETVAGLADADEETMLAADGSTLAAPAVTYFAGTYWLYAENITADTRWGTLVYTGPSPTGPWTPAVNSNILRAGDACPFPFIDDDGTMHLFLCHLSGGSVWDIEVRTFDTDAATTPDLPVAPHWPWAAAVVAPQVVDDSGTRALQLVNTDDERVAARLETLQVADFVLEARVKGSAGAKFGYRRNRQTGRGYLVTLTDAGYALEATTEDGFDGDLSSTIVASGAHAETWEGYGTLRLTVLGDDHKLELNDATIFTAEDGTYGSAGSVTVEAAAGETVTVERITIRPYDGADPTATIGAEEAPVIDAGEFPATPKAEWLFNETEGTIAADNTGNGIAVTFNAEPAWGRDGATLGGGVYGISESMGVAVNSDWTILFAAKVSNRTANRALVSVANPASNSAYELVRVRNLGRVDLLSRQSSNETGSAIMRLPPNRFLPLALRRSSGVLSLTRLDTGETISVTSNNPSGTGRIGFGVLARQSPVDVVDAGTFAYARLYTSALTAEQLHDAYLKMRLDLLDRAVVL